MACFVKNCKNVKRFLGSGSGISFHQFPTDEEAFSKWLNAIGRYDRNMVWKNSMFICSEHFRPQDFLISGKRCYLTEDAYPVVHIYELGSNTEIVSESVQESAPPTSKSFRDLHLLTKTPTVSLPPCTSKHSPRRKRKLSVSTEESELSPRSQKGGVSIERSGSDSGNSRKWRQFKLEHSYTASPGRVQKKAREAKMKYLQQHTKFYRARQSVKKLKKKVNSLRTILKDLKAKQSLSTFAVEHLSKSFGDIPYAVMRRILKNVRSKSISANQYPEELRKFAITLHFYSCKAYNYVRKTFNLALPHPSTIRKWSSTVECLPGFSTLCFDALKVKVLEAENSNQKFICGLLFDEMSIKKQIDFDGRRYWGYVDIGIDFQDGEVEPAQEALVLMVVSLTASWKLPIGYFLIKSLSAAEKANVINEALTRLHEVKIEITSVTCDGPTTHFSMFQQLGCNFKNADKNLKTDFKHPSMEDTKVYSMFDVCHMLKLIRSALADLQIIIDPDDNAIQWEFISKLHYIQEKETLALANKLGKNHMAWRKQEMKVNLECQTLSDSVAETLLFLKNDLKHPKFQECEATVKFIKTVDQMFDLMNCRLPWVKGFKGPLRVENEHEWRPFIENTVIYLLQLKDVKGKLLWQTPRKAPFLGFAISMTSMLQIFDSFVKTEKILYLLTYKFSQDHLELFFYSIRPRNGWNNNPSALQFMRSYKKLLKHADISSSGGNCKVLDTTSILTVTSGNISKKESLIQQVDPYTVRKHNEYYETYMTSLQKQNYDVLPHLITLTELSENVATYIAGYVIKMLQRTVNCAECLELLVAQDPNDQNYLLIKRRYLGAYIYPSKSLVIICYETEIFIRRLMYLTDNNLPSPDLVHDIITNVAAKLLHNLGRTIYPRHEHNFYLLKVTINCYSKIRLHNLSKKYTIAFQGDLVRKKFNKLVLFYH